MAAAGRACVLLARHIFSPALFGRAASPAVPAREARLRDLLDEDDCSALQGNEVIRRAVELGSVTLRATITAIDGAERGSELGRKRCVPSRLSNGHKARNLGSWSAVPDAHRRRSEIIRIHPANHNGAHARAKPAL